MRFMIAQTVIDPNPWQPRQAGLDEESLRELADSIRNFETQRADTLGLLQAPAGRLVLDGKPLDYRLYGGIKAAMADEPGYRVQLAYGHRRQAALKLLGHDVCPIDIEMFTDQEMASMAWTENSQRKDLTPLEEARAIQKMMGDFGWTQEQAAEKLKLARSTVANKVRLLKLPEDVINQAAALSEGVLRELVSLFDLPADFRQQADEGREYNDPQIWNTTRPSQMLKLALAGQVRSANDLHEAIERMLESKGKKLSSAPWSWDEKFDIADPGTGEKYHPDCKSCPQRLIQGNKSWCMLRTCFAARNEHWRIRYLEKACAACGIPPNGVKEGREYGQSASSTDFDRYDRRKHFEKIKGMGCSNLRLVFTDYEATRAEDKALRVPNFPKAEIVCQKREGYCTCLKALQTSGVSLPVPTQPAAVIMSDQDVSAETMAAPAQEENKGATDAVPAAPVVQPAPVMNEEALRKIAKDMAAQKRQNVEEVRAMHQETTRMLLEGLAANNLAVWRKALALVIGDCKVKEMEDSLTLTEIQLLLAQKIADQAYSVDTFREAAEKDPHGCMIKYNKLLTECGYGFLSPWHA